MAEKHRRPTAPVVAIANQKGGTGKTTTTLGIASAAAAMGKRVLVIDVDPQANATAALGVEMPFQLGTYDALRAASAQAIEGCINATTWDHVDCVPADLSLQERDMDSTVGAEWALSEAMLGSITDYDLILIDCPPSVGRLTVGALVAADRLLVVTEPSAMALQGVAQIRETYETVRRHMNKRLRIAGIIVNLMPARGREAQYRLDELIEALGKEVWEPPIPRRESLREAAGAGVPIHSLGSTAEPVTTVLDAHTRRLLGITPDIDLTETDATVLEVR